MYGWTDPLDPDGAPRRPEPPTEQPPAWLTDRPEPRSSYLFGDEPEEPADTWPADTWRDRPTERWHPEQTGELPLPVAPFERPDVHPGEQADLDLTARQPADLTGYRAARATAGSGEGRHRQPRRFPRPLVIGGAAAAATLVVSLGVGALMLPGSDQQTDRAAVDDTVAAAPALPGTGTAPGDALNPASPTASPSSARPTPSASRTVKPTPTPSRTTAPSRQLQRSSSPSSATTRSTSTGRISAELQEVVDLVNAERAKAGCRALSIDDKLMLAAQRHSQDQADHQTMSHDGSDGSDVGERLDRVGYEWRAYGENVAWNQKTPAAVMDAWMNSPGHRANILNCSFTEIGVGVARSNGPYWTQDFGTPR